jgi:hypothetical protein
MNLTQFPVAVSSGPVSSGPVADTACWDVGMATEKISGWLNWSTPPTFVAVHGVPVTV